MYKFSDRSLNNLATCHPDLIRLFNEVIRFKDCSVISGMRTPEEQNKLYQQGRTTEGPIVTNIDGYTKKSKHNHNPSLAADVVPYPIDWEDTDGFKEFGEFVLSKAKEMNINIQWGGFWSNFIDWPHYQLKED